MSRLALVVSGCLFAPALLAGEESAKLSLSELVQEALARNPEVQMAQRGVEAKRARVPQAAALPDPILMSGVLNEGRPVPFQTLGVASFSEVYLGLTQDLPFFGKRRLRREAAEEEAGAAEWALEAARRRVAAAVAQDYYDLYATHAALDVIEESTRLLEELVKVANTRLSVGQASQQDVLDAEVEVSRLEERRSQLSLRRSLQETLLEKLLLRSSPEGWGRPEAITPRPLPAPLEEVLKRAQEESPLLHEKARLLAEADRQLDLARRQRQPDFSVTVAYHNRGRLDPYYTFGGAINLPNLHGRQKAALEESAAVLGGAQSGADLARAEVAYEVSEAYRTASTSADLLKLYEQGILKQARLALDSALSQYRVGKVDFLTLVTGFRRLLDYNLSYQEQLAEHEKALARVAVHVGSLPAGLR